MNAVEELLLTYGPLGIMTLFSAWALVYMWKELKTANQQILKMSRAVREAEVEARERENTLLRELADSELEDKEQYLLLCREMRGTLEKLGEKLDEIARQRYN